jgi:hypothetical protein
MLTPGRSAAWPSRRVKLYPPSAVPSGLKLSLLPIRSSTPGSKLWFHLPVPVLYLHGSRLQRHIAPLGLGHQSPLPTCLCAMDHRMEVQVRKRKVLRGPTRFAMANAFVGWRNQHLHIYFGRYKVMPSAATNVALCVPTHPQTSSQYVHSQCSLVPFRPRGGKGVAQG